MVFDPEAVRTFERDGWNRAAPTYEASFAVATRQFIPALLDAGGVGPDSHVLDLCCGPGFTGGGALKRGARVRGMDFSPSMLVEARSRFPAIGFDEGDAEAPPYADATFDAVLSNFGVHHVPRPMRALTEAHRILKPKGQFVFTIWAGQDRNIAWKLVFDAIARFGDPKASTAPPPGGGFSSAADCLTALREAGFIDTRAHLLRTTWRHPDAASLLAALRAGTARMAAMVESQPASLMPAILDGIEQAAAPWRDQDGLALPIACVLAAGVRP
jgi:SAM-dependent methyltransferase